MEKERIAGRYRVEHELGKGGMGRVFLVEDEALHRPLAMKKMLRGASNINRARFIDEARITAQLTHPNIVPVFHLGRDEGELFLTMRVVDGQDLRQILMGLRRGDAEFTEAYPPRRLLRIFLKICDAISYAHDRGILHRDLKPSNIMVGAEEDVMVMDWGLAKPITLQKQRQARQGTQIVSRMREDDESGSQLATQDGDVVGTPAYMSPEQANNDPMLDQQSDVYALGAILYRLVTGHAPYEGSSIQIIKAVLSRPPLPPSARAPHKNIAPALEAIILKALERDKEQRYSRAADLRQDLAAYLDGQRVSIYNESVWESLKRFAGSYRLTALAILSIFIAALLSLWALTQGSRAFRATAEAKREQARLSKQQRQVSQFRILAAEELAKLNESIFQSQEAAERFRESCRSSVLGLDTLLQERAQLQKPFAAIDQALQALLKAQEELPKRDKGPREEKDEKAAAERIESLLAPLALANQSLQEQCDSELAEAMLWRDLEVFEAQQATLKLGLRRPLIRARAYLRLFDFENAQAQIASFKRETQGASVSSAVIDEARALEALLQTNPVTTAEELAPLIDRALKSNPGRIWLQRVKAETLARLGQHDKAADLYLKLMNLAPLDPRIIVSYVRDILSIHGHQELVESCPKIVPNLNEKQYALAVAELFQQRVWNSRALAPKNWGALREDLLKRGGPKYSDEIETFFAAASLRHRQLNSAIEVCQRVLKNSPNHLRALGILAEALLYKEDFYEAARLAKQGLQRSPDNDRLNYVYGEILRLRGETKKAIPYLKLAARPSLESYRWEKLARCYSLSDDSADWERGIVAIRKALARDNFGLGALSHPKAHPKTADPRLHETFGDLRRRQGRFAQAILHYLRGAKLSLKAYGERDAALRALILKLKLAECHEELELKAEAKDFYTQLLGTISSYLRQDSQYFPEELSEMKAKVESRLKTLSQAK